MSFRKAKIQNYSNSNLKQELYEGQGTKKDTSEEMSFLVDQTLRISNLAFVVGLLQLQSFIDKLDRENGIYLPINE